MEIACELFYESEDKFGLLPYGVPIFDIKRVSQRKNGGCPHCGTTERGNWPIRDGDGESVKCMSCGYRLYRPVPELDVPEEAKPVATRITSKTTAYRERINAHREDRKRVAKLITAAREAIGLTRAELGRAIGVDTSSVHGYENGDWAATEDSVRDKISEVLGIPRDQLWKMRMGRNGK